MNTKTPFQRVVDDLTSSCGCACHVGTGYRTSCEHCAPRNRCLLCLDAVDPSSSGEFVPVHPACLHELEQRADRDARIAELERERDGLHRENMLDGASVARVIDRAEAAEQRVRELEQALREIEASETEWRLGVDANCEILRSIARRALTRDADEGTV